VTAVEQKSILAAVPLSGGLDRLLDREIECKDSPDLAGGVGFDR